MLISINEKHKTMKTSELIEFVKDLRSQGFTDEKIETIIENL